MSASEPEASARPTVLVVDDEPDFLRALRVRLDHAGYRVVTAPDGPAATRVAAQERPDVIVLDVGLPGEDGYQVARRLRARRATSKIPVIFYSARTTDEDLDKGWDVRAAGYLGKVAGSKALIKRVADTLELYAGSRKR